MLYPIKVVLPSVLSGMIEADSAEEAFTKAALAMEKEELDNIVEWDDWDGDVSYEPESLHIYDPVTKVDLVY